MVKIIIDSYPVSVPHSGFGEFCIQIGRRLSKRADELRSKYNIELYFLLEPQNKGIFGDSVHYICVPAMMRWIMPLYPFKADLLHVPYQLSKVKYMRCAQKQLLTVHDINFIYEKRGRQLNRAIQKFMARVSHVDSLSYISHFAHEDTCTRFNIQKPYRIIYNGVSDMTAQAGKATLPPNLPNDFLFHISSLLPKKNIHLLIDMMKYLPEHNLVIAGNWDNAYASKLKQNLQNSNTQNIYMLSDVTEEEKAALYSQCRAFLFPSLCEGFGLPPIEAMHFGKPVFLSTLTSLPEIGGEDAFYWEELSPKAMSEVLRKQLEVYDSTNDYPERLKRNATRFQWDKCVEEYIHYYLEILEL